VDVGKRYKTGLGVWKPFSVKVQDYIASPLRPGDRKGPISSCSYPTTSWFRRDSQRGGVRGGDVFISVCKEGSHGLQWNMGRREREDAINESLV
jgi:hypothetical protein